MKSSKNNIFWEGLENIKNLVTYYEKIIVLQVSRKDQFERKNGGAFDADEFNEFPERYISNFAHKFAPYSSVIVNGIFF